MIGFSLSLTTAALRGPPPGDDIKSLLPPGSFGFAAGGFKPSEPQPDRLFAGGLAGFWAGGFKGKT